MWIKQNSGLTRNTMGMCCDSALRAATQGRGPHVGRLWPPGTASRRDPSVLLTLNQHRPWQTDLNVFFPHLSLTEWQTKVTHTPPQQVFKHREIYTSRSPQDNIMMEWFSPSFSDPPSTPSSKASQIKGRNSLMFATSGFFYSFRHESVFAP